MSAGDRSIGVVLQDIVRNIQDIVRFEVRLAKTELREEVAKARSASALVTIGVLAGIFSIFFLLMTAVYALTLVVPNWAAALLVATGIAIVAGVTLGAGLKQFKSVYGAPKTVASLKENVEWAKQQIK
jgi:cytochrome c biogenesis protein CcdA